MFKKDRPTKTLDLSQHEITTIIGEGFHFVGELNGNEVIRIEGKITGNLKVTKGVILGEHSLIEGDIETNSAIIYGTVNGNIKTLQLEIKKTGHINGNISTETLEVELGATYNGKLEMKQPKKEIEKLTGH